jgi:16S rRNA processing protein RimM
MSGGAFLIVGGIQKPHGIRGELYVRVETDRPDEVFRPGRVLLLGDGRGHPDGRSVTVDRARPFKDGLLLKAVGLTSRTAEVDAMKGAQLLLPREELAPLAEGEIYTHQLVGLRVVAEEGEVGVVRDLYDAPGGQLLGVDRPGKAELLIPFVQALVKRIDVEAGVLELDAPPGLLDL